MHGAWPVASSSCLGPNTAKEQPSWMLLPGLSSLLTPNWNCCLSPSTLSSPELLHHSLVHRRLLRAALQPAPNLNVPRFPSDTSCPCCMRAGALLPYPTQLSTVPLLYSNTQQIFDLIQRTNPKWGKSRKRDFSVHKKPSFITISLSRCTLDSLDKHFRCHSLWTQRMPLFWNLSLPSP